MMMFKITSSILIIIGCISCLSTSAVAMKPEDQDKHTGCWYIIKRASADGFPDLHKVLDEFENELKDLTMEAETRERINREIKNLRQHMLDAVDALKPNDSRAFLEALSSCISDIGQLGHEMDEPTLEDEVYFSIHSAFGYLKPAFDNVMRYLEKCDAW